jgi:hypothetical protein
MADALAIDLVTPTVQYVDWALTLFALVLELFAFVHCLLQKREAFPAVGTLSKGIWLALTGIGALLTFFLGVSPFGLLGLIGLTAAAVYILDVRPGIKELSEGGSPW